ncbi:MAG: tRNA (adenosine(37)-N6)-threonylcarbamoyltransferase complex dimerization subunit type 1 TsaB [Thermodesulfobacteriota bacterium]
MIILAVHSTSPVLSVAVTENERVLAEHAAEPDRRHLENLPILINNLLTRLELKPVDIEGIAVARGPGSFSGIRVGLATAKGMALALGKPVVGVSSLAILAWQGLQDGEWGFPIIDARRNEVYTGLYHRRYGKLDLHAGPLLAPADSGALPAKNEATRAIVCGDVLAEHLASADPNRLEPRVLVPSAAACAYLGWLRFRSGGTEDIHSLAPLYIRRSDAEERSSTR